MSNLKHKKKAAAPLRIRDRAAPPPTPAQAYKEEVASLTDANAGLREQLGEVTRTRPALARPGGGPPWRAEG